MLSDFVYNWKYDSDFYFKQVNVNHNNYKCMSIALQRSALGWRVGGRLVSGDKILNTKNTYTRVDKIKLKLTTVYR